MAAPIVVVGAGQGGLQAAESLRTEGFDGEILLLGAEPVAPYHRPPLSKGLLLGEMTPEQLSIRQPAVFEKKRITFRSHTRVTHLDPVGRRLTLAGGGTVDFEAVVLATGARPRRLPVPGGDAAGVHCLRDLSDVQAIAADMENAETVVVVGGGFIGLEMAAVARKLGKAVTVVEAAPRLMARVATPPLSAHYLDLHQARGVTVLLGTGVVSVVEEAGRVKAVVCTDGMRLPADVVVLGIGVEPETTLAEGAGLPCDRGVIVDDSGRTAHPSIFAIGDCAARRLPDGRLVRLESVQNAVELGKACAAAILGKHKPFTAVPWFWSDQYDAKLQMVGLSEGYDAVVTRGDGAEDGRSWFYFRDQRLVAIDSINRPADHMAGRKLLAGNNRLTAALAADGQFPLKEALTT